MFGKISLKWHFLLVSICLGILVFAFVSYTQWLVKQSATETLQSIKDTRELSVIINEFKNSLHFIESRVYQHSVISEEGLAESIRIELSNLSRIIEKIHKKWGAVKGLQVYNKAQTDFEDIEFTQKPLNNLTPELTTELKLTMKTLVHHINTLLEISAKVETKYPGMLILTEELVPRNRLFLETVSLAISESELTESKDILEAKRLLDDIRYSWSQQISFVRLYVANRSGTFGDPEMSMKANLQNRENYIEIINRNLEILKTLAEKGSLGLQQMDSIEKMKLIVNEYEIYFKLAQGIYMSDNWRADLKLINNTIRPVFATSWYSVVRLEEQIKAYSRHNTLLYNKVIGQISEFIWIFTAIIFLLLLGGYVAFEFVVRRPIHQVAMGLEQVAKGKQVGKGFHVNTKETGLLVDAFYNMQAQVNSRQNRLQAILDNAGEGIITIDEKGIIETFNNAAQRLFGYGVNEVIGKNVSILTPEPIRSEHDDYLKRYHDTGVKNVIDQTREVFAQHKDGSTIPVSLKISELNADGRKLFTALIENVTERKAMIENLRELAEHDSLTGLYNRHYLNQELKRLTMRAQRQEIATCALIYVDLDNFKFVNDSFGHAAGDLLLVEVSGIISKRLRGSDLVSRIGGDEFVIIIYEVNDKNAIKIADSIRQSLHDYAFKYQGKIIDVGCSVGIAMVNNEVKNTEDLLSCGDFACQTAKRKGRNKVHFYTSVDDTQRESLTFDIGWARRIKLALKENRFVLAYQQILDVKTSNKNRYEVLLRMLDESGNIIMPSAFLEPAERFNLIQDIDKWVVKNAIQVLLELRRNNPDLSFSINLSAQSFENDETITLITQVIKDTAINPLALNFEITETSAIAEISMAASFLERLHDLGCQSSLDDFGVGYSSFAYLKELPVDYVKIDGSFIKDIVTNDVHLAVVKSMNDISHAMGKKTVAEFVEDEKCMALLKEIGVDYAQGYYIGKPELDIFSEIKNAF